jgi:hypothetical protein
MRFAVTSVATGRGKGRAQSVCDFVRDVKAGERVAAHPRGLNHVVLDFEGLTPYIRDLPKKQWVTGQSLRKIEEGKWTVETDINTHISAANYALTLRSAEYQNAPELLDDIVARYASGLGLCDSEPVIFDEQEAED